MRAVTHRLVLFACCFLFANTLCFEEQKTLLSNKHKEFSEKLQQYRINVGKDGYIPAFDGQLQASPTLVYNPISLTLICLQCILNQHHSESSLKSMASSVSAMSSHRRYSSSFSRFSFSSAFSSFSEIFSFSSFKTRSCSFRWTTKHSNAATQ